MRRNLSLPLQIVAIALVLASLALALQVLFLEERLFATEMAWLISAVTVGFMILSLAWLYLLDLMATRNTRFIYLLAQRNKEFLTLQMENQRLESEERYAEAMQTSYDRLRRLRHDIRNQMIGLLGLLDRGDLLGAADHLKQLQAEIVPSEMLSLTKIPQVDAILSFKMQQAATAGIRTDLLFVAPDELPLPAVDCCSILGNILDNAIEGAQKVPVEERYLLVEAGPLRNMWRIRVVNASDGQYRRRGESFLSTKEREWHGIGLRHTEELVEANQGYLLIDATATRFSIEIFLPWNPRTNPPDEN